MVLIHLLFYTTGPGVPYYVLMNTLTNEGKPHIHV